MKLEFDEANHVYTLDGRRVPSVTEILDRLVSWRHVNREYLERAATFGSHVHQAIDLFNRDELDEDDLDPNLATYLGHWKEFLRETGAKVVESEIRMACRLPGFAGTADAIVELNGELCLVDVKTGVMPATVGPQTAAYVHLWNENNPDLRIRRRYALVIDFHYYAFRECKNPADWSVFLSAFNCWRFVSAS